MLGNSQENSEQTNASLRHDGKNAFHRALEGTVQIVLPSSKLNM